MNIEISEDSILYEKPVSIFKMLRLTRNWSPKDVADRIDRSYSSIYSIEEGIRNPTKRVIKAYAELFKFPEEKIEFYMDRRNIPFDFSEYLFKVMLELPVAHRVLKARDAVTD